MALGRDDSSQERPSTANQSLEGPSGPWAWLAPRRLFLAIGATGTATLVTVLGYPAPALLSLLALGAILWAEDRRTRQRIACAVELVQTIEDAEHPRQLQVNVDGVELSFEREDHQ